MTRSRWIGFVAGAGALAWTCVGCSDWFSSDLNAFTPPDAAKADGSADGPHEGGSTEGGGEGGGSDSGNNDGAAEDATPPPKDAGHDVTDAGVDASDAADAAD